MTGAEVKEARIRLGLSQKGLADALGITQAAVSYMENGKRPVTDRTVKQIEQLEALAEIGRRAG